MPYEAGNNLARAKQRALVLSLRLTRLRAVLAWCKPRLTSAADRAALDQLIAQAEAEADE